LLRPASVRWSSAYPRRHMPPHVQSHAVARGPGADRAKPPKALRRPAPGIRCPHPPRPAPGPGNPIETRA
jgi:hypothetical protein